MNEIKKLSVLKYSKLLIIRFADHPCTIFFFINAGMCELGF
jgi:hypothetical protein